MSLIVWYIILGSRILGHLFRASQLPIFEQMRPSLLFSLGFILPENHMTLVSSFQKEKGSKLEHYISSLTILRSVTHSYHFAFALFKNYGNAFWESGFSIV
jgi:hypothetical protein